jgi:Dolichyl-phosphate-mannose-protein mannosyltransferase
LSGGDYLGGVAIFALMLGAVLWGAWLLLTRRLGDLRGAERVVAFGVLATLGLLAVHLLPGILGILGRGSVLVAAAAWVGACHFVPERASVPVPLPPSRDAREFLSRPLALAAAGLAAVFFAAFVGDQMTVAPGSIDFINFHLPSVIGWIQTGSIWDVTSYLPDVAPGHYPNNGDVMLLAFILPWHNDFLGHLAIWPFFPLTGVAVYAFALRLGAARAPAMTAAALTLALPVVAVSALSATITDSVMLFGFVAGLLFLARHHHGHRTADLVLAGLSLGISFGTKWYGVSAVAIVVVVWVAARLLGGRDWRTVARDAAIVAGLVALAGGLWMLRNWIVSGNPVFPVKVAPFGITIFDAPPDTTRELAGFTILDYVGDWDPWWKLEGNPELRGFVLDGIVLQWWHALAAPALLILAGSAYGAVALVRRWPRLVHRRLLGVALVSMALVIAAYVITPYTAGGPEGLPLLVGADSRYVVPALMIGAAVTAWAAGRPGWGTVLLGVLAIAAMAHGIHWAGKGELSAAKLSVGNWIAAVGIVGVLALGAWALEPWVGRLRLRFSGAVAAAVIGVPLAVVAVAAGQPLQQSFNDDRYAGNDPVLDAVQAAGPGQRVGLTSVWTDSGIPPILPSFGPRFENEVEYVGPVVDEMQRRYGDRAAFTAALERGGYDFLIAGLGRRELAPPREGDWARAAGWEPVVRSDRLELFTPPGG